MTRGMTAGCIAHLIFECSFGDIHYCDYDGENDDEGDYYDDDEI